MEKLRGNVRDKMLLLLKERTRLDNNSNNSTQVGACSSSRNLGENCIQIYHDPIALHVPGGCMVLVLLPVPHLLLVS